MVDKTEGVRIDGREIWVGTDSARWLPKVDPANREVMLSVGAFLEDQISGDLGLSGRVQFILRIGYATTYPRPVSLRIVMVPADLNRTRSFRRQ